MYLIQKKVRKCGSPNQSDEKCKYVFFCFQKEAFVVGAKQNKASHKNGVHSA